MEIFWWDFFQVITWVQVDVGKAVAPPTPLWPEAAATPPTAPAVPTPPEAPPTTAAPPALVADAATAVVAKAVAEVVDVEVPVPVLLFVDVAARGAWVAVAVVVVIVVVVVLVADVEEEDAVVVVVVVVVVVIDDVAVVVVAVAAGVAVAVDTAEELVGFPAVEAACDVPPSSFLRFSILWRWTCFKTRLALFGETLPCFFCPTLPQLVFLSGWHRNRTLKKLPFLILYNKAVEFETGPFRDVQPRV